MRTMIWLALAALTCVAVPIGRAASSATTADAPASAGAPADASRQAEEEARFLAEAQAAMDAALDAAIEGPAEIRLLDQAVMRIAAGQLFVPAKQANALMVALGNPSHVQRQGLVMSASDEDEWLVDLLWNGVGYVSDEEAREWKPDELLRSVREATAEANVERLELGHPTLDIVGWIEPPHYDRASHRLIWSFAAHMRSASGELETVINYNGYLLGRNGFVQMTLITDEARVDADKQVVAELLSTLRFAPGKRYADFDATTDRVAAYGITGLLGVTAAKKLGLFAALGVLLLKGWKLVAAALFAVGMVLLRLFRRRGSPPADQATDGQAGHRQAGDGQAPDARGEDTPRDE